MNGRNGQRAGLLAALGAIELTGEEDQHDHNYETGCRDYTPTYARPADAVTDDLLAELERRGWKLVQIDPFAKPDWSDASELEGTNEGVWQAHADGLDCGLRPCRQCAGLTNAPAIGGADAEPAEELLTDRVERIERYLDAQTADSRYSWRNV